MFRLTVFLIAVCAGCLRVAALDEDDTDAHWDAFKDKFNKTYDDQEEEEEARGNFEKNLMHVALHNIKDEHEYDKDVHEYSDMSEAEQIEVLCQTEVPDDIDERVLTDFSTSERQLPSSVDWRDKGVVTAVKNQGSCGSCWSFSAAQALEGQAAQKWGSLWTLNEQQLVDCASSYGNHGCNGGWPQNAFNYIKNEGGLVEETCYPYKAQAGSCQMSKKGSCYHFQISDWVDVGPAGDENAVAKALAENGPLTSAIYVSNNFMHYGGGVFYDSSYTTQPVNHGVLIVGYGSENGQDYWIIKNSWGVSWGENGYMKLARNRDNHLHVASYTSYPTM